MTLDHDLELYTQLEASDDCPLLTTIRRIRRVRHLQENRYWSHGAESLLYSQDLFCSSKDPKYVSSTNILHQHVRNSVSSKYYAVNVFKMVSLDWHHLKRCHFHILLKATKAKVGFLKKCITLSLMRTVPLKFSNLSTNKATEANPTQYLWKHY
jgi:hypothetical protein